MLQLGCHAKCIASCLQLSTIPVITNIGPVFAKENSSAASDNYSSWGEGDCEKIVLYCGAFADGAEIISLPYV